MSAPAVLCKELTDISAPCVIADLAKSFEKLYKAPCASSTIKQSKSLLSDSVNDPDQTKEKIAAEFTHTTICETMLEALDQAMKMAQSGDVILLSPACSSYDQFDNYEQRGDLFREACLKYIQKPLRDAHPSFRTSEHTLP